MHASCSTYSFRHTHKYSFSCLAALVFVVAVDVVMDIGYSSLATIAAIICSMFFTQLVITDYVSLVFGSLGLGSSVSMRYCVRLDAVA